MITIEEMKEIVHIIQHHDEDDGDYCDTGADMEWACRSECVDHAIDGLRR
jgi:hypothetical protein